LKIGSRKVAIWALSVSGMFCILSPLLFYMPSGLFLAGLCFWGIATTADSPQLSKLVANSITPELKGTALTFTTCIGFALTIVSIQLLTYLQYIIPGNLLFLPLMIGPAIGVWQLIGLQND
ncbi:MAG: MFS transporter, partial [Maribacter sp.]